MLLGVIHSVVREREKREKRRRERERERRERRDGQTDDIIETVCLLYLFVHDRWEYKDRIFLYK